MARKNYRLIDETGRAYESASPGEMGGHRRSRIYGRLDCPNALRWLAKGYYAPHRVFFADEKTARGAGYRACAICMPDAYRAWKRRQSGKAS
ncbi:MAG: metal-binding protein [Rhodospirillaceae bacterium]|nr:metal-binding protein [Rhodospirillaceae bacterium]MBT4907505.1 metal-binding protein [Rhodospirillaceae bacterium]MBT5944516.1 metal-binding protein [Rhodospirillaceae bacterium]MBT6405625.1 metal-binding protein [Rhodospirillaceae bacterium]MBT6537175.1 metal-binding protein [Rhodospirillaceae bacterium]